MLSLPGAVAGTLAKGAVMVSSASAARAMDLRTQREENGSSDNDTSGYRFGDITRGLLALASERGPRVQGSYDDREESSGLAAEVSDATSSAVSSTAGTAFAGGLLEAGSSVAQAAAEHIGQASSAISDAVSDTVAKGQESRGDVASEGYRFGDFTRGLVAAGRESRGGEDSREYKFGDVTRGLFSKFGGRARR
eukprot:TRINITY_DN32451_c0_g1_i1.p1 TRINITY_DN32451_c0_g1~~TRINITY_DN32451_c0_g1_i1.p1  ORF type:complete len:194 (-),score=42.83 TRINITY_DN32451_c0_g1_i1:4-585(-)